MKKYAVVLTLILFAALVSLTPSCGNSAADEQARLDSIRIADSLLAVQALEDSLQQAYDDSVAAAMDSLQNALDAAQRSGNSGGSSSSKAAPKEEPKVKEMTVETKGAGTKKGGMTPKLQPKEETLLDKKKGGTTGDGGSLLDKKKGGGSGGGVKEGGLLKKKKGGQP